MDLRKRKGREKERREKLKGTEEKRKKQRKTLSSLFWLTNEKKRRGTKCKTIVDAFSWKIPTGCKRKIKCRNWCNSLFLFPVCSQIYVHNLWKWVLSHKFLSCSTLHLVQTQVNSLTSWSASLGLADCFLNGKWE